jgi:hypothetical protein
MSWDSPKNKKTRQRNVNVAEEREEPTNVVVEPEAPNIRDSLMLKRVLVKAEKEVIKPT